MSSWPLIDTEDHWNMVEELPADAPDDVEPQIRPAAPGEESNPPPGWKPRLERWFRSSWNGEEWGIAVILTDGVEDYDWDDPYLGRPYIGREVRRAFLAAGLPDQHALTPDAH